MARRRRTDRTTSRATPPDVTDLVARLGSLLSEIGLTVIEVTVGDVHVRVERTADSVASVPTPAPSIAPAPAGAEVAPETLLTIEAPMVGTFYRASSPTADPYVGEGDLVKEGQVLCIIEAMKLMNEIEAKAGGRVVKILVENGQPVEYGQPLFLIDAQR